MEEQHHWRSPRQMVPARRGQQAMLVRIDAPVKGANLYQEVLMKHALDHAHDPSFISGEICRKTAEGGIRLC